MTDELAVFTIGEPLPFDDGQPLPEGARIEFTGDGLIVYEILQRPTPEEITVLDKGRVSMRLLVASHTLMFVVRFGANWPWCDAPYSAHRVPPSELRLPAPPAAGHGIALIVVGVDSETRKAVALHALALSNSFSLSVLREYEKQLSEPADDARHVEQVKRFQSKTTQQLADAATIRFVQGDHTN